MASVLKEKTRQVTKTALARRIEQSVKQAGLDNESVAPLVGLESGSGVGHWRSGRSEPSFSQIERLASATKVPLYWLITGEREPMGLKEMFEVFRAEVGAGADPGEVWERLTGEPMSPDERVILAGQADALREYLRGPGGARWAALDQDEQEAVSRLVELLGRNRSAASPERGGSAG